MEFLQKKQQEIIEGLYGFFAEQVRCQPRRTLRQVEAELQALYVRQGNDWTGRGIIGDNSQMATIAGLEAVRAACLETLEQRGDQS